MYYAFGFATNVFVGRVVKKTGTKGVPLSGLGKKVLPKTQFVVGVLENVKGNLEGTVNQAGRYSREEGRRVCLKGDRLLEPGREYLFSTGRDPEKGC